MQKGTPSASLLPKHLQHSGLRAWNSICEFQALELSPRAVTRRVEAEAQPALELGSSGGRCEHPKQPLSCTKWSPALWKVLKYILN